MMVRDGGTHFYYSFVDEVDGTVTAEEIPAYIDSDAEEIVLGIDLPYNDVEYKASVGGEWTPHPAYLPPMDRNELDRRLPELEYVWDDEVKERVTDVLINDFDSVYWVAPASRNHHPQDERWTHGQWIHTKRALSHYLHNVESRSKRNDETGGLSPREWLNGLEAVFYHDIQKYVAGADGTYPQHASGGAAFLRNHPRHEFEEDVVRCVERHNGPTVFDGAPEPETEIEHDVHTADMAIANSQAEYLLINPTEELKFAQTVSRINALNEDVYDGALDGYAVIPGTDELLRKL